MSGLKVVKFESFAELNGEDILKAVDKYGSMLVRISDQPAGLDEFEKFTQLVASNFQVHGNPARNLISPDGFTQEVDAGSHALPAHSEMTYLPFYPDTMWFYCVIPPKTMGETIVSDGLQVMDRLSVSSQEFFENNKLKYSHVYPKVAWQRSLSADSTEHVKMKVAALAPRFAHRGSFDFHFDEDENMHVNYVTSAFSLTKSGQKTFANSLEISFVPRVIELRGGCVTMEDGNEIPKQILQEISDINRDVAMAVNWQAGDILMLDNSRVMHGRHEIYDEGDRQIFVRLGNRH